MFTREASQTHIFNIIIYKGSQSVLFVPTLVFSLFLEFLIVMQIV